MSKKVLNFCKTNEQETQPDTKPHLFDSKKQVDVNSIEGQLFRIIDDIDTASDMYKPKGNEAYHNYINRQVKKAHQLIESDGYDLYYIDQK